MNLGIAFSGGGVRAAAQLGIMQALLEHDIKPKIFAGTSGGSIVAVLMALGYTPRGALERFKAVHDILDVAYVHIISGLFSKEKEVQGLFKGKRLERSLDIIFDSKEMGDVYDKCAIVATDLNRARQVIFSNCGADASKINDNDFYWSTFDTNKLSEIVRGSCGLPGIFIPKQFGDTYLVDGGLVNNIPSDIVKAMGADRVISVDLGYQQGIYDLGGAYSILSRSFNILFNRASESNIKDFDVYLHPALPNVGVLDTTEIDECFEYGYAYGSLNIGNIKNQLGVE